jgi:hypothetical protein
MADDLTTKPNTAQQDAEARRTKVPDVVDVERTSNSARGAPAPDASYDEMTKDELIAEAEQRGLTVTRADGEEGEPLKQDYVDALSK